jgi:hypothetical protein
MYFKLSIRDSLVIFVGISTNFSYNYIPVVINGTNEREKRGLLSTSQRTTFIYPTLCTVILVMLPEAHHRLEVSLL